MSGSDAAGSTDALPHADPGATAPRGALEARVRLDRGSFDLDIEFAVRPGESLALLGPNGAGKSTVLALLAGLLRPDAGRIVLDGRVLVEASHGEVAGTEIAGSDRTGADATGSDRTDTDPPGADAPGRDRVDLRPERRGIGLLGQEPRLFPHLTAVQNVAFGPRAAGMPRREAAELAAVWLVRVGLDGLGDRRPAQLSGGQGQRVAIARALAAGPSVLLLDEPFASLDAEVVPGLRRLLREQLAASGTSSIIVSHDVLDAVVLADRTAVLERGRVVDEGPTRDVLAAPRSLFTAAIAGVNLAVGVAEAGGVRVGETVFSGEGGGALVDGMPAAAVFRPASVVVATRRPENTSLRNIWRDRLASVDPAPGGGARLRFAEPPLAADVTAASVADLDLASGDEVWLAVKAAEVRLHSL